MTSLLYNFEIDYKPFAMVDYLTLHLFPKVMHSPNSSNTARSALPGVLMVEDKNKTFTPDQQQHYGAALNNTNVEIQRNSLLEPCSLYHYLKRAGVGAKTNNFILGGVTTVDMLVKIGSHKERSGLHAQLTSRPYCLTEEEATCLSEILTDTESAAGHLRNFDLLDSAHVANIFVLFYSDRCAELKRDTKGSLRLLHCGGRSHVRCDPVQLDRLGRQYSRLTSQSGGSPVVSAIEVITHLERHRMDPQRAVETVEEELLELMQPPPPPELKPTEEDIDIEGQTCSDYECSWDFDGVSLDISSTSVAISTCFSVSRQTSSADACFQLTEGDIANDLSLDSLATNMLNKLTIEVCGCVCHLVFLV